MFGFLADVFKYLDSNVSRFVHAILHANAYTSTKRRLSALRRSWENNSMIQCLKMEKCVVSKSNLLLSRVIHIEYGNYMFAVLREKLMLRSSNFRL